MKNLKNIFKCLSVAAVAGLLSMNTVSAASTCGDGEVVHTNYYLFLAGDQQKSIKTGVEAVDGGTPYQTWNSTDKYNNIMKKSVITYRQIPVCSTNNDCTTLVTDGKEKWTVEEFWENYYTAYQNQDKNHEYYIKDQNTSYFLHDAWYKYTGSNWTGSKTNEGTKSYTDALLAWVEKAAENKNFNSSNKLVNKGTITPTTTFDSNIGNMLEKSEDALIEFKIGRTYAEKDSAKDGLSLQGKFTTGSDVVTQSILFSPAVYYVEFCEADPNGSSTPTPSDPSTPTTGQYTITYEATQGGKGAPASQTSDKGTCTKISDTIPKLSGHDFLGWATKESTDKDPVEADSRYAPGKEYCGDEDLHLYSVWKTNTGISAHVVAFGLMAAVAAGALVVAKKKNLFKQI